MTADSDSERAKSADGLRRAQEIVARYIPKDARLSDELMKGRRLDAWREDGNPESASILPDPYRLLCEVRESLDAITGQYTPASLPHALWLGTIASEIAKRILRIPSSLDLKCYARGVPEHCHDGEWLFDFCAVLTDDTAPEHDRFTLQLAVAGEVEWNASENAIHTDFEKLMVTDSLVCFMVFRQRNAHDAGRQLDHLQAAAERRRSFARRRGMMLPPLFLVSCYVDLDNSFLHRAISGDV